MGKDSLIKSTAKKSDAEKEKEKPKKKSTKKAAAKSATPKKATAKSTAKKSTKATKSTKAAKTVKAAKTAKTKKAAKTAKTAKTTKSTPKAPKAAKKSTRKPTLKELIFKKFDGQMPAASDPAPKPDFSGMTAPPFITTEDSSEGERLKRLLAQKFDMAEIKAAAKPPEARNIEKVAPEQTVSAEPEAASEKEKRAGAAKASQTAPVAEAQAPGPEPETAPVLESAVEETAEEKPAAEAPTQPESPAKAEAPAPQEATPSEPEKPETAPKAEPEAPKSAPKAATEQTAQQAPPSSPLPPVEADVEHGKEPGDPVLRAAKIGILIAAAVVLMIVWASITNSGKYYITAKGAAVKIEKGNFSPTGKSLFVVLHGYQLADPIKETYSKKEIFPIIFGYYLDRADTMLDVAGLPDYNAITADLEKAKQYALTKEMRDAVQKRTNYIQRMTLLYKAEVDASKPDIESLESALDNLEQVRRLVDDPVQRETIDQKIASVTAAIEAAEAEAAEKAAAEEMEETEPAPQESPQE